MKIALYIFGWIWFLLALSATATIEDSAVRQTAAVCSWIASFVALGAAAICGRIDALRKATTAATKTADQSAGVNQAKP